MDGQGVQVTLTGTAGNTYSLQASSDLQNWSTFSVQTNATGTLNFTEPLTTNALRFYRAVSASN